MSLENVIRQCAPTMANIKTGSLFPVPYITKKQLEKEIQELNSILVPKGLYLIPLRYTEKKIALLYMYRPERLKHDLYTEDAQEILKETGYSETTAEECILHLMNRLQENNEFPHEIGLFLSYPAADVKGFIDNHAKNFKFSGMWKVYGDEDLAKNLFNKYKRCTDIYCASWSQGMSFDKLTVSS